MRLELICPAAEDSARLQNLAMAILAGLTPEGVEISFKDDTLQRLDPERDLDFKADLAALTVSTKTADRAYGLADTYRRHGVKVVLGGIHPTVLPEEALQHSDAVVMGEAEGLWPQVLQDVQQGQLKPIYKHHTIPSFNQAASGPRRDLFRSKRYIPVEVIQASRGCPFDCEFCSVTPLFGRQHRLREMADLLKEIQSLSRKWIMFADDNILGCPAYARQFFQALVPLKLTWFGQASLHGLENVENVKLMAASGCKALFIGFESLNPQNLAECGKKQNHPERYRDIVHLLHDHGIGVWASFVFGLDHDNEACFERTVEFAIKSRLIMASFALLTPYPGTRLYHRLRSEGRLLDEQWWLRPNRDDFPLFRPRHLTLEQLYAGWQWAWKEFYSGPAMLQRFWGAPLTSLFSLVSYWPLNWHQRRLTREKIIGGDKFCIRDRR